MNLYLNAIVMLLATIAAFLVLAKCLESLRGGRLFFRWRGQGRSQSLATSSRISIEQTCIIDGKRRLLMVRCDDQRILLMTGGSTDLVISVSPVIQPVGTAA